MMKKLLFTKYWWIVLLAAIGVLNYLASIIHFRIDLTAEKRYTLSAPTKKLLAHLPSNVNVHVFLAGEMPAGFKKLSGSTNELLQEFKEFSKGKLQYHFSRPGEGLNDSLKQYLLDSLHQMGLNPLNIHAQVKEGEGQEQRLVYPGALLQYNNKTIAIDLLQGQSTTDGINSLNNAEALLEYKFASAINKLTQDTVPLIGYLTGNDQPTSYHVYDLIENNLRKNYFVRIFPIDSFPAIPKVFDAMFIVKPQKPFTDEQKLKLDQYVMNGGKIIWMIDQLYAEMDSLERSQNEFIAFDRGLNVEDILFKYGVRINGDLVQDLNCDRWPSVVGMEGGKPQIQLLPWPYFPLLANTSGHPIAKNLDYVVARFPNSIDTVEAQGVRKTILLSTAGDARILSTPARVTWNSIQSEEDFKKFNQKNIPVAVLLEGDFQSLYTNRLTPFQKQQITAATGMPFASSTADNKMIVISNGEIAMNAVTQKEGPLPLGMNKFTHYQYANKDFINNCVEYLTDASGILEARSKDYTLRLLDKKKTEEQRSQWQWINIIGPVTLVVLFGLLYQYIRKRQYE